MRYVLLFLVLAVTWLLWSALFHPLLLGLGLGSCLLTLYLARRMGVFEREVYLLHLLRWLPGYWLWLSRELIKANFQVARIVLSPSLPISPTLVELDSTSRGALGHALLANSITLTPGTVTIDENEGRLKVHCLTRAGAHALLQGEMDRRVAAVTEN
jgi:multicomponent Na+:H+ antiporter subunit E